MSAMAIKEFSTLGDDRCDDAEQQQQPSPSSRDISVDKQSSTDSETTNLKKKFLSSVTSTTSAATTSSSSSLSSEPTTPSGLKILFLSSDTGGGHRASAEALAHQFTLLYPSSTYTILDILTNHSPPPWNASIPFYKHLSSHPRQWGAFYSVTDTPPVKLLSTTHHTLTSEISIRSQIRSLSPDVVVSVHPLATTVPAVSCRKVGGERNGRHVPFFTVVTDLGNCHSFWFGGCAGSKGDVERVFVPNERIAERARVCGVGEERIGMVGLPIRVDFGVEAERMGRGGRMGERGGRYRRAVRERVLGERKGKVVLVMGGGEGVGSLSELADALYVELTNTGIDATIVVVCGRNERLKKDLEQRDWTDVLYVELTNTGIDATIVVVCGRNERLKKDLEQRDWTDVLHRLSASGKQSNGLGRFVVHNLQKIKEMLPLHNHSHERHHNNDTVIPPLVRTEDSSDDDTNENYEDNNEDKSDDVHRRNSFQQINTGEVTIIPMGYISNMAEYMLAADMLVSKAGPGTIAEAASVGLPILMTSFLPGQEEGNVDFVMERKFGDFRNGMYPQEVATEVGRWLMDEELLKNMSQAAMAAGNPHAARDIARCIGDSAIRWKELMNDYYFVN